MKARPKFKVGDIVSWNGQNLDFRYKVVKVRERIFRDKTLFFCDLYYTKGRRYIEGIFERALRIVKAKS